MKVKELIELLKGEDPEAEVICQSDAEGNYFSPLDSWWYGAYRAETTWSGKAGMIKLTENQRKLGYTEADLILDGVPAIFLTPVN